MQHQQSCRNSRLYFLVHVSSRLLKDSANVLAISITQICNLSIELSHFPKLTNESYPCTTKVLRQIVKILDQSRFYQLFLILLRKKCTTKQWNI